MMAGGEVTASITIGLLTEVVRLLRLSLLDSLRNNAHPSITGCLFHAAAESGWHVSVTGWRAAKCIFVVLCCRDASNHIECTRADCAGLFTNQGDLPW